MSTKPHPNPHAPRRAKARDAIGTIHDLHGRCVIDKDTGCWHLRTAYGREIETKPGRVPRVWVYGKGATTATQAAWELKHHQPVPEGRVVYRTCCSKDCIAPHHLKLGTRKGMGGFLARTGRLRGDPSRVEVNRRNAAGHTKLTPELRQWLIESPQSGVDAAHGLGVSQGRVNTLRQEYRKRAALAAPSIFAVGDSAMPANWAASRARA